MPLRLALADCRARPQFRLGLRRFCRHACTSWHFTVGCIALLDKSRPWGTRDFHYLPSLQVGKGAITILSVTTGLLTAMHKPPRNLNAFLCKEEPRFSFAAFVQATGSHPARLIYFI